MGSPENPDQLMIALEPEAAAIFCQEKKMSDFHSETGTKSVDGILSQPNSHYMVVDIGGNELCCSVFQLSLKVRENAWIRMLIKGKFI